MTRHILAIVFIAGLAWVAAVHAQGEPSHEFADRDGTWVARTADQSMATLRVTAAQRQAVVQKRDAIVEAIRASRALTPLKGLDIVVEKSVEARADDQGQVPTANPIVMKMDFTFASFVRDRAGRVVRAEMAAPTLNITTNDPDTVAAHSSVNKFFDYFDPSLPRSAAQLIACGFEFQVAHDAADASFHASVAAEALHRLLMTFEYDAMTRLVDGRR